MFFLLAVEAVAAAAFSLLELAFLRGVGALTTGDGFLIPKLYPIDIAVSLMLNGSFSAWFPEIPQTRDKKSRNMQHNDYVWLSTTYRLMTQLQIDSLPPGSSLLQQQREDT
jgi:hypothetical protein